MPRKEKGRGRRVTQLTLQHDGVGGDEPEMTRGSSEVGGAAVREAGEEEDDGEVAGLGVFCLGTQQEEDDDDHPERLEGGGALLADPTLGTSSSSPRP